MLKVLLNILLEADIIIGRFIAPLLGITIRFIGEEPSDAVTRQYNEQMKRALPAFGIKCLEIPRIKKDNKTVSASSVRKLLSAGSFEEIRKLVPDSTWEYLVEHEKRLRSVIHN